MFKNYFFILLISSLFFKEAMCLIKIGHRGAAGYELENTLKSFQKGIDLNVDYVEFDVHECKSGELIVMHDSTIDRTTNGKGEIKNLTLNDLRKFKTKNGEDIPTLEDVLSFIDKKCKVNIELKDENIASKVAETIQKFIKNNNWKTEDFLVSSFNHYALKEFKNLMPQIKIGALFECIPIGYTDFVKELKPNFIVCYFEDITKELINNAHQNNIKVLVYTVNKKEDIEAMKKLGVDGVISDVPDIID